jgi:hypothetical protein
MASHMRASDRARSPGLLSHRFDSCPGSAARSKRKFPLLRGFIGIGTFHWVTPGPWQRLVLAVPR